MIRTLLHNLVAHPVAGLAWAAADLLGARWPRSAARLEAAGERAHSLWTA